MKYALIILLISGCGATQPTAVVATNEVPPQDMNLDSVLPTIPDYLLPTINALRPQVRQLLRECAPTVNASFGERDQMMYERVGWQTEACALIADDLREADPVSVMHATFLELISVARARLPGPPPRLAPESDGARTGQFAEATLADLTGLCPLGTVWCCYVEGALTFGCQGYEGEGLDDMARYLAALAHVGDARVFSSVLRILDLDLRPIEMLSATTAGFREIYTAEFLAQFIGEHPTNIRESLRQWSRSQLENTTPGMELARAHAFGEFDVIYDLLCDRTQPAPLRAFVAGLQAEWGGPWGARIDPCSEMFERACPDAPPRNCDQGAASDHEE